MPKIQTIAVGAEEVGMEKRVETEEAHPHKGLTIREALESLNRMQKDEFRKAMRAGMLREMAARIIMGDLCRIKRFQ